MSKFKSFIAAAVLLSASAAFAGDEITQSAPTGTEQVQTGTEQTQTAQATQSGTGQVQTTQVGGSVVVAGNQNSVCYQCVQTYVIINSTYVPPPRGHHMNYCGNRCQQVFTYPPARHTSPPRRHHAPPRRTNPHPHCCTRYPRGQWNRCR